MTKRVLVTGGAGFIGSHLCEELLKRGYDVVCLDNYFTGSKDNIRHLLQNPKFEFKEHDITEPLNIQVDEIYNLACPAAPIHYQRDPIKTLETSILGMSNILKLAYKIKRKNQKSVRVLQASTSEVYGDPDEKHHPQKEEYWGNVNPVGIRSCYDEGKRAAECLMMDYNRQYKVDIRIVRIFNTYGPRMALDDGRVVSSMITQALKEEPITIFGNGKQTRSFCFVQDLVRGLILFMEQDEFKGPLNLGNPHEIPITELANTVIRLIGSQSKIEFKELPQDDPKQRKPNIDKAKEILKWEPSIQLEEGLRETIEYFMHKISMADYVKSKMLNKQSKDT